MCEMNTSDEKKLLGMIGLCRKCGRLIIGVPMICEYLAQKKNLSEDEFLVIEASDVSDNTHKRLSDKCNFYKVKKTKIFSDCNTLGAAIGKGAVAAVAVTGRDMCRAVADRISAEAYSLHKSGKERS